MTSNERDYPSQPWRPDDEYLKRVAGAIASFATYGKATQNYANAGIEAVIA